MTQISDRTKTLLWASLFTACFFLGFAAWVDPHPIVHAEPASNSVGVIGDTFLQSATTSAVVLAGLDPERMQLLCMKGTPGNANTVYVGVRSTITAGTGALSGFPLAASETTCWTIGNGTQVYVIAGVGGSSVSWFYNRR